MKRFLYVFVLLSLTIVSCNNDDDNSSNPDVVDSPALKGSWNMASVTGGFLGLDHIFDTGIIVWDFDDINKTVKITNNNLDDAIEDLLPSGTYSYSIVVINGNQELIVNDVNRGNLELVNSQFTLSEQFRDGLQFTFNR